MDKAPDPLVRFVIIGIPRSGTNMLCTLLNSHPEILCHHELYNPHGIMYALHLRDSAFSLGSMEDRNKNPDQFLNNVWQNTLNHKAVGFKFTNRDDEDIYWKVIRDPNVRKIILKRENRVKTYVSKLMSEATGLWEVYDAQKISPQRPKIRVELEGLLNALKRYSDYYSNVEKALIETNQKALEVKYEDLFNDKTRQSLLEYLGVSIDTSVLKVESIKQNPIDLKSTITNYEELLALLENNLLKSELISLKK